MMRCKHWFVGNRSDASSKAMWVGLGWGLLLWVGPLGVVAQTVETRPTVDTVRIGDQFDVQYVVRGTASYPEVDLPDEIGSDSEPLGELEVVNVQRFQQEARQDSIVVRLQYFGIQDTLLPAIGFKFYGNGRDTTVFSAQVPIFFGSSLPSDSSQAELRPLKEIYAFNQPWWVFTLWALAIVALGLLIGWFIWTRVTKREPDEPEPVVAPAIFESPLVALRDELDQKGAELARIESGSAQLANIELARIESGNAQSGRVDSSAKDSSTFERYYDEIGDAIRTYIEAVYEIRSLEMTTYETLRALQSNGYPESLVKSTRSVLLEADKIKFARFTPTVDHARVVLEHARDFARRVELDDRQRLEAMRKAVEEPQND
jgi:hypothetical protein